MKLEYIKANGIYYKPQKAGVKDPYCRGLRNNYPVCVIKKKLFGRWQIDRYDKDMASPRIIRNEEDTPNQRIILYPSGIEEIRYSL